MNSITQELKYKQSIVKYALRNGVTAASIVYKKHRKTIYRWIDKYDGTIASLANKSRCPHTSPNVHTESEIKLIMNYKRKNKYTGLVILWVKLMQVGYKRSITNLYRMLIKLGIYNKVPSKKKKYQPKLYQTMRYPGERVQVDVKYVLKTCIIKELIERNERYYQYTAIDEYTRQRVIWSAKEHSTYESSKFIDIIIKKFKYKIEEIQTDNGFEFTKRLQYKNDSNRQKTMFEEKLKELNIKHKLIKPYTPRHNEKVERSHKKDQERFYHNNVFFSFENLVNRVKCYIKEYNNFPMRPLKWLSPNDKYEEYIRNESSIIA